MRNTQRGVAGLGWAVVALCLPCVLGTAGLLTLSVGPSGFLTDSLASAVVWLFTMAGYGPALLIAAAPLAILVSRRAQMARRWAVAVWVAIALGLVSAALFYSWLVRSVDAP